VHSQLVAVAVKILTVPGATLMVMTSRNLLSDAWEADVRAVESAIARFPRAGSGRNPCRVAFFEIPGDRHLHVNVIHRYATASPRGWAGPAALPDGFVHNRRFAVATASQLTRFIREMVFADRIPLRSAPTIGVQTASA
jgi:hypothetical protein